MKHKLGEVLFSRVGEELQACGIKVNTGTMVDATIVPVCLWGRLTR